MKFNYNYLKTNMLVGVFIAFTTSNIFAQEINAFAQLNDTLTLNDLAEMSLEDLLDMKITVASKKAEKLSDAPGMITSYSKKDIERYGYYTLKDLSNITSGYSSFSAFGETNLETRGQKAGSWNVSKHLLLIDGIPVNHARANSAPLEYQVPLFFADRVEFLKGPGSALYGTSAFYGVMNIISKDLKEKGAMVESRISYGDLGNAFRIMGNAVVKTDVGQTKISLSHLKKGFSGDSLGVNNKYKNFDNDNSTFFNAVFKFTDTKLKGFSVGMIYMKRNSHGGEFWGAIPSPNNEITWEEVIPYIRYQTDLTEKVSLNSYLKYNTSTEKSIFGASWASFGLNSTPFQGYSYITQNIEGLAEVSYDIDEHSSLIAGLNFDTRQEAGEPYSYSWSIHTSADTSITKQYAFTHTMQPAGTRVNVASAYLQYQRTFNVMKGLILTAGSRFDNGFSDAGVYSQFSPRASLVLKVNHKLNLKALYGQALRVPGVKEIGLNTETVNDIRKNGGDGNPSDIPNVGAEVIKSFEVGLNYNTLLNDYKSNLSLALSTFYNITTDALDGAQYTYTDAQENEQTPNYFKNTSGNITATGLEFDVQYVVNKDLRFMINHAVAKAIINDSINFTDVPTQKTNFGATYVLPVSFDLSTTLVARQIWGYTVADATYTDDNGNDLGTNFDGYTMVDLNIQAPINKNLGLELQIRNLLDIEWKQPSLLGQNTMIPLSRRNFMFTLYSKF